MDKEPGLIWGHETGMCQVRKFNGMMLTQCTMKDVIWSQVCCESQEMESGG